MIETYTEYTCDRCGKTEKRKSFAGRGDGWNHVSDFVLCNMCFSIYATVLHDAKKTVNDWCKREINGYDDE